MTLTRPVAEGLLRLKHDPEFQAFRAWLNGSLQEARSRCESLEGVALHRAQGQAKAYGDLAKSIEDAPALFEQVKHQK